jgi:hypothetical protein
MNFWRINSCIIGSLNLPASRYSLAGRLICTESSLCVSTPSNIPAPGWRDKWLQLTRFEKFTYNPEVAVTDLLRDVEDLVLRADIDGNHLVPDNHVARIIICRYHPRSLEVLDLDAANEVNSTSPPYKGIVRCTNCKRKCL